MALPGRLRPSEENRWPLPDNPKLTSPPKRTLDNHHGLSHILVTTAHHHQNGRHRTLPVRSANIHRRLHTLAVRRLGRHTSPVRLFETREEAEVMGSSAPRAQGMQAMYSAINRTKTYRPARPTCHHANAQRRRMKKNSGASSV
jgi:hypothetical protein